MLVFEKLDDRLMLAGDTCHSDDDDKVASAVAAYIAADGTFQTAEAGSTFATATDIGTLGATRSFNGAVGGGDPLDVIRFSVSSQSQVAIGLSGLSRDIDLYLYDSSGQRLGASTAAGAASESITSTLVAGTYYLAVAPYRTAISNYVLTASATATTPPVVNPTPPDPTEPSNPTTPVTAFPDVAYYGGGNEWNLNAINAPESWAQGYTGQGVVVAVVDTGVDLNHSDLMSQIWTNPGEIAGNGVDDDANGYVDDIHGWDFSANDNNPDDGNGDGTHVAGTIAADANGIGATGVAPDATIMPVRVLSGNGSGSAAAVATGIRYAAANGADIINLSLGGALSSVIQSAIQYALSRDVLVVAASGNESASTPGYPARFSASMSNVISVGAHNSSNSIASFSNDVGNSGAVQVDAPGVGVYSTYIDGRYTQLSGTSMATPHVAGLAALALSANHNLTASQLRSLIVQGANRTIAGSDSRGGINAALTVALVAAGQTGASATTAAAQSQTPASTVAVRRFLSSGIEAIQASGLDSVASSPSPVTAASATFVVAGDQTPQALREARDYAIVAMISAECGDEDEPEYASLNRLVDMYELVDDDLALSLAGSLA